MELREIYLQYITLLKANFFTTQDYNKADIIKSTNELLQEVQAHYGDISDENDQIDTITFIEVMKECEFEPGLIPETTELRWLLCHKN